MADTETFSGGCLCGRTRFELTGEPGRVSVCHCRMCQRLSGAPYVPAVEYSANKVVWIEQPSIYKSSEWASRSFCSHCGSSIGYHTEDGKIWVSVGTLDRPETFEPEFHIFVESKMPWSVYDEELPQYEDAGPI